ncbi:MAG: ATP-binding protein [Ilumatobacter sp.]|uniref:sensor histidine kinase n=1 Tax=Ilumatobacter sp. TaxID=1967498 RepID=UPI00391A3DC5
MTRERSLRLRTRVTLFFALIALFAGTLLIGVTYGFARNNLLDDRTNSAETQAFTHANDVAAQLDEDATTALDGGDAQIGVFFRDELQTEPGGFAVLGSSAVDALETRTDPNFGIDAFPNSLVSTVLAGGSARQFAEIDGEPYVAVGVYINRHDTGYFEAFPAATTDTTLTALITALGLGGVGTLILATLFGFSTSRRLLRPLSRVADAAEEIASGGLDTRLESESDPDLDRLAGSFNGMADAVQARIEREARFASDVSHELRSPITALTAAVEVLAARREDIPERTQQALDIVVSQVRRFDSMVIDLLELSRLDAGATDLNIETSELSDLTRRVAARFGASHVAIEIAPDTPQQIDVDRIRFERILGNLIENAEHHGGGVVRIELTTPRPGLVQIAVEDGGPGVARSERDRIFERFARGSAARHRIGTGLGLALVAQHADALGGATWVEDRAMGGARFVVELPVHQPTQGDDA